MSQKDLIVKDALKITRILNRHLNEEPECKHSLKEITAAFRQEALGNEK